MEGEISKKDIWNRAWDNHNREIANLWQRSIFLTAFIVLIYTAYGTLQITALRTILESGNDNSTIKGLTIYAYHFTSIFLVCVGIILSILWCAMAKGSKFIQSAHEEHIKEIEEMYKGNKNPKMAYCDLGNYPKKSDCFKTDESVLFCGFSKSLKAFRYSPSKINILLGQISLVIFIVFLLIHIGLFVALLWDMWGIVKCGFVLMTFLAIVSLCFIKNILNSIKGGKNE